LLYPSSNFSGLLWLIVLLCLAHSVDSVAQGSCLEYTYQQDITNVLDNSVPADVCASSGWYYQGDANYITSWSGDPNGGQPSSSTACPSPSSRLSQCTYAEIVEDPDPNPPDESTTTWHGKCRTIELFSCPFGYSEVVTPSQAYCEGPLEQVCVTCSDGLPPDLGGYPGCDRPDLQTCPDGSIIPASTACDIIDTPEECFSSASAECSSRGGTFVGAQFIEQTGQSPICLADCLVSDTSDWIICIDNSCTDDPNNDGELDVDTDSDGIPDPVDPDNDNDGIVDDSDTSPNGDGSVTINGDGSVNSGGQGGTGGGGDTGDTGDPGAGDCDPTALDYIECLDAGQLPDPELTTISDTDGLVQHWETITANLALVQAAEQVSSAFLAVSGSSCPTADIPFMGETYTMDMQCTMAASIGGLWSSLMLMVWAVIAFRVFMSA